MNVVDAVDAMNLHVISRQVPAPRPTLRSSSLRLFPHSFASLSLFSPPMASSFLAPLQTSSRVNSREAGHLCTTQDRSIDRSRQPDRLPDRQDTPSRLDLALHTVLWEAEHLAWELSFSQASCTNFVQTTTHQRRYSLLPETGPTRNSPQPSSTVRTSRGKSIGPSAPITIRTRDDKCTHMYGLTSRTLWASGPRRSSSGRYQPERECGVSASRYRAISV